MTPEDAIATIAGALRSEDRVRALFLSGSHGVGLHDDWSHLDFVMIARDGADDATAALWRAAVERCGPLVLWRDRIVRPALINAITEDMLRVDLVMLAPGQTGGMSRASVTPLIDHDGLHDALPAAPAPPGTPPARLSYGFEEFLRILALLPVAAGRREYLNGITGVMHLRTLLTDLMIEQTAAPHRGGALHLNRLITGEQQAALAALPLPVPERDAMIAAHLAHAAAYLPRARRLARQRGVAWPERFEDATWGWLKRELDVDRPYTPEEADGSSAPV